MNSNASPRHEQCLRYSVRILDVYASNLDKLPMKERIHFIRRAYRSTGREDFAREIERWTRERTVPGIKRRAQILHEVIHEGKPFPPVKLQPTKIARYRGRNVFLEKHPEVQFFRRYSMDLFQGYSCGAHKTVLSREWQGYIQDLQAFDFDSTYVDLEVLEKVSSFAVNTVIFMEKIGVDKDLHRRFIGYLRGAYLNDDLTLANELDSGQFTSFVYNLTHIVIAASGFYQEWVDDHRWIGEVFSCNIHEILTRCSDDVIAEVGLCLKLLQMEELYSEAFQLVVNHLLDNYDFDVNLAGKNLVKREHTNAVIMVLFSDVEKWVEGPYLD